MSREDESSLPAILIGLVFVVAVGIGGFLWFAAKRNEMARVAEEQALQARDDAEFQARTTRVTLWRDTETVEDVEKARMLCEEKVSLLKRRGEPQSDEEKADRAEIKDQYDKAKKLSDSCIDYLIAGIARRFDKPDDYAEIKKRMKESDDAMNLFSFYANEELKRELRNIRESDIMRSHTLELPWVNEFKTIKHSDEELAHIKATLEKCRLKNWDEIE